MNQSEDSRGFAAANVTRLYHYQDYQPGEHANRLADILENHRIYCSNPAHFNDPWDCRPHFNPALLDDPAIRAETLEFVIGNRIEGPESATTDHRLKTDLPFLKRYVLDFSEAMAGFISERYGVYCLSADPCVALMWSHYSRSHRGICLEFNAERTLLAVAQKVRYQGTYPQLRIYTQGHDPEFLLVKSSDWSYELEYRLICPRFTDVKNTPLLMNGDYLAIGKNDLVSIILGCQAGQSTEEDVKQLVSKYAPNVRVQRARRMPNRYGLFLVA